MNSDNPSGRAEFYGSIEPGWGFYRRTGARLSEDPVDWIVSDEPLDPLEHHGFHQFDKAHTVMLTEEGLIPPDKGAKILRGLREMEDRGFVQVREESGHQGHAGEAFLIEEYGEDIGGFMHLGRSSNDLSPVSKRIMLRSRILEALEALLSLMEAYCDVAEVYKDAVMPTYTVYQHAQVGTFGWYVMSWERPIERAFNRLVEIYQRVNKSPAGSAAETTTDFPINRDRTAELLGFDGIMDNGKDATRTDFDVYLEVVNAFATTMISLSEAADRLLMWYFTEVGRVDVPDRYINTSSIMPQKRNSTALTDVQSSPDSVVSELLNGYMNGRGMSGKAAPAAGVLSEAISHIEHWASIIRDVEFDRERARDQLYLDWVFATDIAGLLVREEGIPWRSAHQIVGILVRTAEEQNMDIRDVSVAELEAAAAEYLGESLDVTDEQLESIIDPDRAVDARSAVPGSPAPNQVQAQIDKGRATIREDRTTLTHLRDEQESAASLLESAIDDIITTP